MFLSILIINIFLFDHRITTELITIRLYMRR